MKLEIETPCHESWNQMTPCGSGRHCSLCSLTVIDAEKFSDEELIGMISQKNKLCVRIRPTRVKTGSLRVQIISRVERFLEWMNMKKFAAFAGSVLLFVSCTHGRRMGGIVYNDTIRSCRLEPDRLNIQNEMPVNKEGIRMSRKSK